MPKPNIVTLPRLIDCHVHFREPGLTHKADMATEAASAWAGGVGTVCEMPNTIPATTSVAALADKVRRAEGLRDSDPSSQLRTGSGLRNFDMRFLFGATEMAHLQALTELLTGSSEELQRLRAKCCGLKLYFDHSTGDQKASDEVIAEAFKMCAEHGFPLVGHCEDAAMNEECRIQNAELKNIETHSLNRPPESEVKATAYAIELVRKTGAAFHVAHLSTKGAVDLVRAAKKEGLPVTCEVTPHHLFLNTDDYKKLGTLGKMNPPLRSPDDQKALWEGIADGTVDCISTDHAPHTLEEKQTGEPLKAPSGVPGVETMLPLLLSVASGYWPHPTSVMLSSSKQTDGVSPFDGLKVTLSIEDVTRLCFENPNRIFKLGKTAEMMKVDLLQEWVIHGKELHSKCGWTPFEGWKVCGKIIV